jgi:hypothetical protein|tara:strand:+ start:325 stop:564 length:240 start_codon:yes stop_codon:yes gene_type:complete
MVILEINLGNREKTFTNNTLQECVEVFFTDYVEAIHEVVECKTYEGSNPNESMTINGNKSCQAWLKQIKQGVIGEKDEK